MIVIPLMISYFVPSCGIQELNIEQIYALPYIISVSVEDYLDEFTIVNLIYILTIHISNA